MKVYFGINDYIEKVSLIKITDGSVEFVKFPYKKGEHIGKGGVWHKNFDDYIDMIIIPEDPYAQLTGYLRNECNVMRTISYENFQSFIETICEKYKDDAVMFRVDRIRVKVLTEFIVDDDGREAERYNTEITEHIVAEVPVIQYDSSLFPMYDIQHKIGDKTLRRFRATNGKGEYRDFDSHSGVTVVGRTSLQYSATITSPLDLFRNFLDMPKEINGFKLKEYVTEFKPEIVISD